jgi:hypothetical protein
MGNTPKIVAIFGPDLDVCQKKSTSLLLAMVN